MPILLSPRLQALEQQFNPSVLTPLSSPLLQQKQLELWIKRDDLIHPIISGNKWRKLKYILNHALQCQANTLISMGGAYSNHLHALAYTGRLLNIKTIAYIRGEQPKQFSPTLNDLVDWGMQLHFISRSEYRQLRQFKRHDSLPNLQRGQYWLPEGGATELALQGITELVTEINQPYDVLCVPCGTGTTCAGLIQAVNNKANVIGFSALKGADFLTADISKLLNNAQLKHWHIELNYHFGGFAKTKPELLQFITDFQQQFQIECEPVYTGKLLYGLFELIKADYFTPHQKIIALHTGGLQGKRPLTL